jgi:hypothetical protein
MKSRRYLYTPALTHSPVTQTLGLGTRGERVTMGDRVRMPYTCATITEIQRCANIVPMNVPHATINDCVLGGGKYKIKAGCITPLLHII